MGDLVRDDIRLREVAGRAKLDDLAWMRGATIVHPGAASAARRWPHERFAHVARAETAGGRAVVVTGSSDERALALEVADGAGLARSAVVAGRTTLAQLARLVAHAGRVVCGDTVALPERPPIVVVDNGSGHDIAAAVATAGHRPDDVEVVTLLADCGPAARTIGAHRLTTELVGFCDDDSWFAPGALAVAADRFARDRMLALLQARVLVGEAERLDPVCARVVGAPAVLGFVACGVVLRRRALLAIGAFEHCSRFGGEESPTALDLAAAGWQLAYDPAVVVHHHPRPSERRRGRHRATVGNDLATWWSRLPWRLALRYTADAARRTPATVAAALPQIAHAVRHRRRRRPAGLSSSSPCSPVTSPQRIAFTTSTASGSSAGGVGAGRRELRRRGGGDHVRVHNRIG